MQATIFNLLGGIGLYLFGMHVMTDALRQLASRRTRDVLARFTTSPLSGVLTGALTTALIQSSSATMVTTIGFVGAGLLTFPQAIGIVFGANIGTTVTGWMVTLIGLKLQWGTAALPLLFAASLVQMLARGSWARVGAALAGFSLIFLGLEFMQQATTGFEHLAIFDRLPGDSLYGRLVLLALGIVVTLIVQSSGAGIAMALVLLGAGTITLPQAAAMMIGMDVGTTFKSVLATLGGSRDMRRTAMAHVVYNVATGVIAFAVLGPATRILLGLLGGDAQEALVAFHTFFNVLGVVLLLPLIHPFARLIIRLVPGDSSDLTGALDRSLLRDADAALDAAQTVADAVGVALFQTLADRLDGKDRPGALAGRIAGLEVALHDLEDFATRIAVPPGHQAAALRYSDLLHRFDHLHRLSHRAMQEDRIALLATDPLLHRPAAALAAAMRRAVSTPDGARLAPQLARLSHLIEGRAGRLRRSVLLREHVGLVGTKDVFDLTDAMRWLSRAAHHCERIVHYRVAARIGGRPS